MTLLSDESFGHCWNIKKGEEKIEAKLLEATLMQMKVSKDTSKQHT